MVCKFGKCKSLWPATLRCVVQEHSRTLTRSTHKVVRGKTPYKILTEKKPDMSDRRIFGSKVKVLKLKKYRKSKLESKKWYDVHVRYNSGDSYRVYIHELGRMFV